MDRFEAFAWLGFVMVWALPPALAAVFACAPGRGARLASALLLITWALLLPLAPFYLRSL